MAGLALKLTIVTGGAGGIGNAVTAKLLAAGGKVAAVGISHRDLPPIEDRYKYYQCDVGIKTKVEEMMQSVRNDFGRVPSGLVNSVGIVRDEMMLDMTEEQWDDVIRTNLKSIFLTNQCFARMLVNSAPSLPVNAGSIVNIASILGKVGNIEQSNYAASKAGVIVFTKSIAKELALHNIRVNSLLPGYIKTPMTKNFSAAYLEKIMHLMPYKRMGTSEEMADVILYLLSDTATYVSGCAMEATGGTYT